jgi:(1->4)-alpha-D-glucan 1-alpha-D-glucosylmutase
VKELIVRWLREIEFGLACFLQLPNLRSYLLSDSSIPMPNTTPLSTYRIQFNREFTFADAAGIVPYLHDLGVTDLYASPCLQARPGSTHGYDISNHGRLNPELGTAKEHAALSAALSEHGMGQMLDVVPNHMGIGEPGNLWWMDVLENGPSSPYAGYFDIDWDPLKPELAGRVLLPILGDQFGRILEQGELRLAFEEGRFRIHYHEHVLPVSPRSTSLVLRAAAAEMRRHVAEDDGGLIELESVVTALEHLPPRGRTDEASVAERRREGFVTRRRLEALLEESDAFRLALEHALAAYNGRVGEPHSFDELERLLDDQAYRLAYWRVAAEEINYRRFFDINELAGLSVERGEVFQATHELVLRLLAEGKVTSLRVDHPDGLYHPVEYLRELQRAATRLIDDPPLYVLVEKILTGDEPLPDGWPVAGTVGYDFLNRLNGIFVAAEHGPAMTAAYERFIGERLHLGNLIFDRKKLILRVALASELNVLAYLLSRIAEKNRRYRDFTLGSLTEALRETIASFPVYRSYIDAVAGNVSSLDAGFVHRAVDTAIRRNRATSRSIFDFIRNILLLEWPDDLDEAAREEHARFVMKFQQLTGPVMAKGVEDTSFYIYNRLVSLNEVGGEPDQFGVTPDDFHVWLLERREKWPLAMNTTSTHDTKRSEDVRARINVLSEIPAEWEERVQRWAELNSGARAMVEGDPVPAANDEYLLYQTLVGAWPLEEPDGDALAAFRERIQLYMDKAMREAKVHTSWINPNEAYDEAIAAFIRHVLDPERDGRGGNPFIDDLREFHTEIARFGMFNALAQTLVKLTSPGVPDVYRGQELWDFSLVDPDNRRPVDFNARRSLLAGLLERTKRPQDRAALAGELMAGWTDGRIKLYVTHTGLEFRREHPELFREAEYIPLEPRGPHAEHLFGFARRSGPRLVAVVVPRLSATLHRSTGRLPSDAEVWTDTRLATPGDLLAGTFRNVFTGREIDSSQDDSLPVARLLDGFPVAILEKLV